MLTVGESARCLSSGEVVARQSGQEARGRLGQLMLIKPAVYPLAGDWIDIDNDQLVGTNPMVSLAPDALVALDHVLVGDFEIDNIVPKPKHLPENVVIQKLEVSGPIDVVDQFFGGDQKKVLFAKVGSSISTASGQLLPREFNAVHLGEYGGRPGVQALYGDKFLVVFVHAPPAPQIGKSSTS